MSRSLSGILLPESVLTSTWFQVLAAIVAFNTLVYVGLTVSKLVPLPRPIHPSRVREMLGTVGVRQESENAMNDIPIPTRPESANPYEQLRGDIARRDIPQALSFSGGVIIVFSLAAFIANDGDIGSGLLELTCGLGFLVLSQVLARSATRARTNMWAWVIACLVLVVLLASVSLRQDSQVPLLYTLVIMAAFAPVAVSWRPTLVAGLLMLVTIAITSIFVRGDEELRILLASVAALAVSYLSLRLRLAALDALADEEARSAALASTDVLTGVLTHNGLLTLMPGVAALAQRFDQEVCVMYFDINGLRSANAQYGMNYGDDVLRGVAGAIRGLVRKGDLVARWGGDEFLVAGVGSRPDADELACRIQTEIAETGLNLGRWPTTVGVGTAAGDPSEVTFEHLVEIAQRAAYDKEHQPYPSA